MYGTIILIIILHFRILKIINFIFWCFYECLQITGKSVRKIVDNMNLAVLEIEFCQLLSDSVIRYAKKSFMNQEDVQINTQGLAKDIEIKQYFRTRAANFLMWD